MQPRYLLTVSLGVPAHVTIVSIYFNKLPEGLFCCLETTYVTRETQVARQINFGTTFSSFTRSDIIAMVRTKPCSLNFSNCKRAITREK